MHPPVTAKPSIKARPPSTLPDYPWEEFTGLQAKCLGRTRSQEGDQMRTLDTPPSWISIDDVLFQDHRFYRRPI